MSRRADEREASPVDRLAGDPGGESRSLPARLGRDGVGIEQLRPVDPLEPLEVRLVVDAGEVGPLGPPLDERTVEEEEPLRSLRVLAGRVQARSDAKAAARAQSGSASATGGSGAPGSSVAIERYRRSSSAWAAKRPSTSIASSDSYWPSSEAAVFSPTPRAPGIRSDGSPRSAMKSATCSGSTP